jgi:hypothetical protein
MMLDSTDQLRIQNSNEARRLPQAATRDGTLRETRMLLRRLQEHKLIPQLIATRRGPAAGGVPLRVSLAEYLDSATTSAALHEVLRCALGNRLPVTLALTGMDHEEGVIGLLEAFCQSVRAALPENPQGLNLLGICMRSHVMPVQAYLVIGSLLGKGPRYVMLDSLQMQHHSDRRVQAATDSNWIELWFRRGAACSAQAVYAESVRSRCPLLTEEKTSSILPALCMPVPAESAWLPVGMTLTDFSDGRGHLRMPAIRAALHACLDACECLIPQLFWPTGAQGSDSRLNNRLALCLDGIGDLVIERGMRPADLHCLRWVDAIVSTIHSELWNYSMEMACSSETLPSLLQDDPSNAWQNAEHLEDWSGRWRQALQAEAVRHRNLLVLSPYSVLPRGGGATAEFTDLLPVLAHADAISFRGAPGFSTWNVAEFSHFHRRAWAAIMRR